MAALWCFSRSPARTELISPLRPTPSTPYGRESLCAGGARMLSIDSISAELGGRPILNRVSLNLARGEAIGIVGPNGSGKTTLLRIIAGELKTTGGAVHLPAGSRIG